MKQSYGAQRPESMEKRGLKLDIFPREGIIKREFSLRFLVWMTFFGSWRVYIPVCC